MTNPTHALLDEAGAYLCAVFPEGYEPAQLVPLDPAWFDRPMRYEDGAFVDDVGGERGRLIERIKAEKLAVQAAGCDTPLGRVQTDPTSRESIEPAALGAIAAKLTAQPFQVSWTMADNSRVAHSADQMIALAGAVLIHAQQAHAAYEAKRTALNAAATLEALWAVVPREAQP